MALKDWKRTKKSEYEIIYYNLKTKHLLVLWRNPNYLGWFVEVYKNIGSNKKPKYHRHSIILMDKFWTKPQALKFAKDYMKRH